MEYQDDDREYIRPPRPQTGVKTNAPMPSDLKNVISEFAKSAYISCFDCQSRKDWDMALVNEHMNTTLNVSVDEHGNHIVVRVRHPSVHSRVFRVVFNPLDPEDGDITAETLVPEPYTDAFRERFMTAIIMHFTGDYDEEEGD
jgi:hypothetical protein